MYRSLIQRIFLLSVALAFCAACTAKTTENQESNDVRPQENAAQVEAVEHEGSGVSGEGRSWTVTFASAGQKRTMEVFAPAEDDGARSLLLLFHGYGDTAASLAEGLQIQKVADKLGAIVVVPQGLVNSKDGKTSWNAGACCAFGDEERDDVALLADIPKALKDVLSFNEDIVDVAGFSNGGFFVEKLVCEQNDRIRGALNVAGGLPMKAEECEPQGEIRLVRVHGAEDTRVPFAGGELSAGRTVLSFHESFAFWRSQIKCSRAPETTQRGVASCRQQYDCPNGHMEFCEVLNGGHEWPRIRSTGLDVFDVAWQVWNRTSDDDASVKKP